MSIFNQIQFKDSANLDGFGRLRVSQPVTLFDSQHQYLINPFLWSTALSANGGTVTKTTNKSSATLSCTTTAGSTAILQSKRYIRYQPGKSQLILISAVVGAATANVQKRLGYFDAANGLFFEQNGTTDYAVNIRSSTSGSVDDSTLRVSRSSWNIDKLDGTGPSGYTLDFTKAQILMIDLEWLGVGRVRWAFVIDGKPVYFHQHLNANILAVQYTQTANLPLRFEVTNLAAASGSMEQICCTVISEGGYEGDRALRFADSMSAAVSATTAGTWYAAIGIRPTATFNSITNRGIITLDEVQLVNAAAVSVIYQLRFNPTVAGTFTYSNVNVGRSIAQTAKGATANTVTGGDILYSGVLATNAAAGYNSSDLTNKFPISQYDTNSLDSIVLCVMGIAANASVWATMNWRESW